MQRRSGKLKNPFPSKSTANIISTNTGKNGKSKLQNIQQELTDNLPGTILQKPITTFLDTNINLDTVFLETINDSNKPSMIPKTTISSTIDLKLDQETFKDNSIKLDKISLDVGYSNTEKISSQATVDYTEHTDQSLISTVTTSILHLNTPEILKASPFKFTPQKINSIYLDTLNCIQAGQFDTISVNSMTSCIPSIQENKPIKDLPDSPVKVPYMFLDNLRLEELFREEVIVDQEKEVLETDTHYIYNIKM